MIIEFLLGVNIFTCGCGEKQQAIDKTIYFASKKLKEKSVNIVSEIQEEEESHFSILFSTKGRNEKYLKGGELLVYVSKHDCKIFNYFILK